MTPAMLIRKVWTTRRGVGGLIALMLVVGALLYATWAGMAQRRPVVVQYGAQIITPEDGTLCPGDVLRYPVSLMVSADELPSSIHVVEGWYSEARGVVLRSTVTQEVVPLVRPYNVQTNAVRIVPWIEPGVYWLDHVSHNGRYDAYTVGPVTVLEPSFCGE